MELLEGAFELSKERWDSLYSVCPTHHGVLPIAAVMLILSASEDMRHHANPNIPHQACQSNVTLKATPKYFAPARLRIPD
jgi:hypothetical protein